jgi:pimeloyl-ACP methyl ester carboxylesterase
MRRTRLSALLALVLLVGGAARSDRRPAQAASGREPVIVIPGMAGSELSAGAAFHLGVDNGHGGVYSRDYASGEKVWVNILQAALPGDDDYFDVLKLYPDGRTAVAPELRVSDIYHSAYDDLVAYLGRQGYEQGVDLWLFPYDWRRDIRATAEDLDALVTQALVSANGGRSDPSTWTILKADIVAHSMGGLVGRYYISDAARGARIDQLITLGSPQLGAAKFLKTLIYGDDFGSTFLGLGLNADEVRDVVQNMPGAMQLLPSRAFYRYYDNSAGDRLSLFVEDRDVDGDSQASGVLDYGGVKQLLLNLGKNRAVIGMAEDYHDAIDQPWNRLFLPLLSVGAQTVSPTLAMTPPGAGLGEQSDTANGVRWDALIGYGYATLGQIHEYVGDCGGEACAKRDELPVDGDGTVAVMSAEMGDAQRNNLIASGARLWYVQRQHSDLVKAYYVLGVPSGDGPGLAWVGAILRGATPTTAEIKPSASLSGVWVAALGRVALEARDRVGQASGRTPGQDRARAEIGGSRYERLPGSEFAFLKPGQPYTLALRAEHAGSVDLKLRVLAGGQVVRTLLYANVQLGPNGLARLALPPVLDGADMLPALQIDANGDGVFETLARAPTVLGGQADRVLP